MEYVKRAGAFIMILILLICSLQTNVFASDQQTDISSEEEALESTEEMDTEDLENFDTTEEITNVAENIQETEDSGITSVKPESEVITERNLERTLETMLAAPANVKTVQYSNTKIKLTWNTVTGADEYEVYYTLTPGENYTLAGTTSGNSYIHTVKPDTTYYYVICACTDSGITSDISSVVEKKTKVSLSAPDNLIVAKASATSIKISWNKVADADGYEVSCSTTKEGTYKRVFFSTDNSYTHTGLKTGQSYYYKVRSYIISEGIEYYGTYTSIKSQTLPAPKPTNVKVSKASATSIKVSWTKVTGVSGYKVYAATSKNGTYKCVGTVEGTSFTYKNLTVGKTYYFKLRSYKTISDVKKYSDYTAITSQTLPVPKPTNVKVSKASATSIKVSWTKAAGVSGYKVYAATSKNGTYKCVGTVKGTSFTYKNLTVGKTYYFKLRSYKTISDVKKYSGYTGIISKELKKSTASNTGITAQEAKKIALAKVGGGTVISCKLDYEHGVKVYEIEIIYQGVEYDIDVRVSDGKIVKFEKDYD